MGEILNFVEQENWIYLLHHMHHRKDGKHEIHHCFVLDEDDSKYKIEHLKDGDELLHIVLGNPPEVVLDHIGNSFLIETRAINGKEYKILVGPMHKNLRCDICSGVRNG
ncbi:MAG: hypothetical protein KAT37_04295 [Candidatus Aenigmarchaeota archaeon]|nr:hypothetical protein [Candidatus Aenigmarchaeota archaeon]